MQQYSLKFTQISKYAPTMVANPLARMKKFVMGVSSLVEKEFITTMLLIEMDISRLIGYAQQIAEYKIREIRKEGKKPRSDNLVTKNLRRRYFTNSLPWGTSIRLKIKTPKEVAILWRELVILFLESNIWASVLP